MNPTLHYSVLALGFGVAWAFGYFVGGSSSGSSSTRGASSTTPLPIKDGANSALASTAIGRLMEGKNDFQRTRSLYEYSLTLKADDMAGAVNEAMRLPLSHRNMALGVLFARWAELDPASAVQYAQLLPKSANAGFLRRTALTAWAEQNFDAALAWAKTLEKGEARNDSIAVVAGQLAKRDPNAALKLIGENFAGRDAGAAYDNVFSAWAETDFASAYAAAQGLTDPGMRTRAMRAALGQKVETDPRLVIESIRTAKLSELRWDLGNRAMSRWAERDLNAARDYALGLPAGELRDQQMQTVAREMARRDPRGAIEWLRNLPEDSSRDEALQGLFSAWAGSDSKAALEAARDLPEGRMRDSAMSQLAQNLVDTDIKTTLAILKELPAGGPAENAQQQVAWRWARVDPKGAAEWFVDNVGENNRWVINQVLSEWSRNDPEAALQWASSLPNSRENKGELIGSVLSNLVRSSPAEAVAQFDKLPAEQQASAAPNLAGSWAWRDPAAAAKWVTGLKNEDTRTSAIGNIASSWGNRDVAGATRWLETLPAGNTRDVAVQSFASSVAQKDPEGAIAWAMTIGDQGKRDGALQGVVMNWARKDQNAAAQWVQTTNAITPETKARLQPMLKAPRGRSGSSIIYRGPF